MNKKKWFGVAAGTLVALAVVVSQLTLPGIAEERIGKRLDGQVTDVEVDSFPAARLLFKDFDQVSFKLPETIDAPERLESLGIETLELETAPDGDLIASPSGTGISLRLSGSPEGLQVETIGINPFAGMLISRRLENKVVFHLTSLETATRDGEIAVTVEGSRNS